MTATLLILAIVVVTALAFDFTNGFHDTANAMATSIATGALKPFTAVALSAVLNLIGAFLSVHVAATVAKGIVNLDSYDLSSGANGVPLDGQALLLVVFTGLIGGIIWNLFTWLLGMPSSSSHALFGGLIGAALAAMGTAGVAWSSIVGKILIPAVASPIIAALVSATGTFVVYWISNTIPSKVKNEHFRHGQIATASLVSLAHGAGDAQKTMGVIFLALVAAGEANAAERIPTWVIVACAVAIALGTLSGGWRVIRTLGKGLVEIESPQGMAAEASSAAIILTSAAGGMALSTTHVSTGSILGTGLGKRGAEVRWGVAMRMAAAWLITIPCAAIVGFLSWWLATGVTSVSSITVGVVVDFILLIAMAALIFFRSRVNPIDASNVNEQWDADAESVDSSIRRAEPAVAGPVAQKH
ncbi:inorganic phosphate transporter [Corynebacterium sp. 320]|uniref:inorganic phosphate transporter n=1 Tax=Corynebacterium TaxID=1716 RepID=UPI00125CAC8D|nr:MULTISPECIES: inorganic phosphate transporter [Corynebacterium]KAB1504137.1 inorganic phosphate transporter [Corynebacterium sp. 320]KAB1552763.1 inorganic phosphate transporter [Corynebacterium sp. 321]KAB1554019.1 inorganic phosphate transporter [Corynebacterium sp. 319]KAB3528273.1 inorganic phosphate transporter [Corynebacterium sp. 250]KAB3540238.1 inorganic phosphate transporter [Corynebacterium sp. 366]